MKGLCFVLVGFMCCGCSRRVLPVKSIRDDSIRTVTEVRYIERLRDTVIYARVPQESRQQSTPADSSHLETAVAVSDAWVRDGLLHHTLDNKPARLPVAAALKDTEREHRRDSVIIVSVSQEIPVNMPRTRSEQFWRTSGIAAWGILLVGLFVAGLRKKWF